MSMKRRPVPIARAPGHPTLASPHKRERRKPTHPLLSLALGLALGLGSSGCDKPELPEPREPATVGFIDRAGGVEVSVGMPPSPRGRVVLGEIETTAADDAAIEETIQGYIGQIKACYVQRLRDHPDLAGRLEASWNIDQGRVSSTEIIANTTGDEALTLCVCQWMRTWRFPSDLDPDVEVLCPFLLSPEPEPVSVLNPPEPAPIGGLVALGAVDSRVEDIRISSVLDKYTGQIQACYEQRLAINPELQGRVEVFFAFDHGRTAGVRVETHAAADSELAECIAARVQRWRFPADYQPGHEVMVPFELSPGPPPALPELEP